MAAQTITLQTIPVPTPIPYKPSPQQQRVFDFILNGSGNAVLIAVAGAGKTTTLVGKADDNGNTLMPGAVDYMTGSVALVAYAKKNAIDFEKKLTARGLNKKVRSGTAHSFGFSAWRYANKNVNLVVDEKEKWNRISNYLGISPVHTSFVKSLLSLAKQRAIGVLTPMDNQDAWWEIVDHFDLTQELADELADNPSVVEEGVHLAYKALQYSIELSREIIDYDDMIYMPLKANCRIWQYDWVLLDEAQDTNPARRELYKRMLKPGGRFIAVGDPAQAIYGFTGADNDSLDILKAELKCQTLPLTTTFRCPKSVVRLAQTWVNHIEAHENNQEGSVYTVDLKGFVKMFTDLKADDAILCRNTKPLVELAFALIRKGVACHVEGKAIGQGLIALAGRWKVTTLDALKNRLETYLERETKKLMEKGKEQQAEALADKVGTLLVIMESLPAGSKVADLQAKIADMFKDDAPTLTLCTVHRSKGLEWERVFLFGRNKYMPSPYARQDWQAKQENHLMYVAVTRSMDTLVEVVV